MNRRGKKKRRSKEEKKTLADKTRECLETNPPRFKSRFVISFLK